MSTPLIEVTSNQPTIIEVFEGLPGPRGLQGPPGTWDDSQMRWQDIIPMPISQGTGNTSLTLQAVRDSDFHAYFFRHDRVDECCLSYQMPHNWAKGTELGVHVHLVGHGTTGGTAVIGVKWAWTSGNTLHPIPTASGWQSDVILVNIAESALFCEVATGIHITPPSWLQTSNHLHIAWSRQTSDPRDTFKTSNPVGHTASNLQIVALACHGQMFGPGSITEWGA